MKTNFRIRKFCRKKISLILWVQNSGYSTVVANMHLQRHHCFYGACFDESEVS